MDRKRLVGFAMLGTLLVTSLVAGTGPSRALARGQVSGGNAAGCREWGFTQPSKSIAEHVQVPWPNGTQPYFNAYYFHPRHFTGKLPGGVAFLHGQPGTVCAMWWGARLVAGKGYGALVIDWPEQDAPYDQLSAAANAAGKQALLWLRARSDIVKYREALVGHSFGSSIAAQIQSGFAKHAKHPLAATIVALDNLRAFVRGDRGGGTHCNKVPKVAVKPRVPALGIGSMVLCPNKPKWGDKRTGYDLWRTAKKPRLATMEVVLAASTHTGFTSATQEPLGTPERAAHLLQLQRTSYYMMAWLNRWLRGDQSQVGRLLSQTPRGEPVKQVLFNSTKHPERQSSAYLPPKECLDLRSCP